MLAWQNQMQFTPLFLALAILILSYNSCQTLHHCIQIWKVRNLLEAAKSCLIQLICLSHSTIWQNIAFLSLTQQNLAKNSFSALHIEKCKYFNYHKEILIMLNQRVKKCFILVNFYTIFCQGSCENPPPSERTSYISFFLHRLVKC